MRMLKYDDCAHCLNGSSQISESSYNESLKDFFRIIVNVHVPQYLNRCPTDAEKQRSVELMKRRGSPGYFVLRDCNHFVRKNCPQILAGNFKGKNGKTIVMEAICDTHLYV